ncbi:hypothetical protein [Salinibaculum rarum]|uniref:hypothetical protein n=1 Tax=Salinibaculum rarum TaxID=3058903 RepID=UPI00265FCE61|nr:hypothetical protein [Salinibaculum sp. KK48]
MFAQARDTVVSATPSRDTTRMLLVIGLVLALFTASAAAANNTTQQDLKNDIQNIGDFVILIIVAVAVPNGAYGFLEWMTAGSSVEKDEQGRKRIRNTFIALAGAGIIKGAVTVVSNMVM